MQANTFPLVLEQAQMISSQVKHFTFHNALSPAFDFVPGQFITLHFEQDGKLLRRSYSIANAPTKNNRIEFAAGYVEGGPGTQLLFNLNPGDTVHASGPFGRLVLKGECPKRYILVATSTGVTPYRAMLPELQQRLQHNPELQVVILQGVQTREDALYREEFEALAKQCPRVMFRLQFSRESDIQHEQHEYAGYVQSAFPALNLIPEQDIVYLCGNPGMIDESFAWLKDHGFAMQHVIREKYISR